jgi:hypothetical protein
MAEYFSHDYDARSDEKIMDLMAEMGWAGYGLYWGILELLYQNGGKMRTQYKRIAFALASHEDSIKSIIENFQLFQINNDFFYSKSVNERLKKRREKSDKARANAYKRWEKSDANALPSHSGRNAIKESKVKDIKGNNKDKDVEVKYIVEEEENFNGFFTALIELFPEDSRPKDKHETNAWLETIDLLHRIDKVDLKSIYKITKWAREDEFWSTNFLSIRKLRRKNKDGIPFYVVFSEKAKTAEIKKPKKFGEEGEMRL